MPSACPLIPSQTYVLRDGASLRYAVMADFDDVVDTVLVLPGRREFIEKKAAEVAPSFLARRFRMIFFEWRGHGFSTRALPGNMRQRDHIEDFEIYLDDLKAFYRAIVAPRMTGRLFVTGHSMGGHLGLRWLAEDPPEDVAGAIFTAPMLALGPQLAHSVALPIGVAVTGFGLGERYAPGQHDFGPLERQFEGNVLTHDRVGFQRMPDYFDAYPDLTVGGVTYAWITAALRSMRLVRDPAFLRRVRCPFLTITGDQDRVTPAREIARFLHGLSQCDNLVIGGARHDVMAEDPLYRDQAWAAVDRFLERLS